MRFVYSLIFGAVVSFGAPIVVLQRTNGNNNNASAISDAALAATSVDPSQIPAGFEVVGSMNAKFEDPFKVLPATASTENPMIELLDTKAEQQLGLVISNSAGADSQIIPLPKNVQVAQLILPVTSSPPATATPAESNTTSSAGSSSTVDESTTTNVDGREVGQQQSSTSNNTAGRITQNPDGSQTITNVQGKKINVRVTVTN
jgi:hypothetical protein